MSAGLHLTVTTPMEVLVDATGVRSVRAEDASGAFGILPGRADFLTSLPASVLRWRDAVADVTSGLVEPAKVETLAELPYRGAVDHPEGIVAWLKPGEWLAVYDSPAPERVKEKPARVLADIWTF